MKKMLPKGKKCGFSGMMASNPGLQCIAREKSHEPVVNHIHFLQVNFSDITDA